jgi:hypothetical protein
LQSRKVEKLGEERVAARHQFLTVVLTLAKMTAASRTAEFSIHRAAGRNRPKRGREVLIRYSSTYEKAVSNRPLR